MYDVNKFIFYKDKVIYLSVVEGQAFCSFHDRKGLSNVQAQAKFHIEHAKEVDHLLAEHRAKKEGKQIKIIQ